MDREYMKDETFDGTFPFTPHFMDVYGFNMHYVDEGPADGEVIVCLHGMPTWGYLYREFITALSNEYRVIVPDHMGFGKTDVPENLPFTMQWHVMNLERFLLTLDVRDITLVVHDWGGPIGFGFAVDHPDLVKRIVILNTSVGVMREGTKPWYASIPNYNDFFGHMGDNIERLLKMGMYHPENLTPVMVKAYAAPFPDVFYCAGPLAFPKDIPIGSDHWSTEAMMHVRNNLDKLAGKPMIAIWGMQDIVFPPPVIDRWKRFYPDLEVHPIEDAAHFLQEDNPAEVIEAIKTFCMNNP